MQYQFQVTYIGIPATITSTVTDSGPQIRSIAFSCCLGLLPIILASKPDQRYARQ